MSKRSSGEMPSLYCQICRVSVPSDAVMMTHVLGRPHQNLKAYQDRQRSLASRSIYVRGFMSGLSSHDYLFEVFKDYGEVKKITFDSRKGPYAFVEFKNVADAQKLLSNPNLVKQKHKMLIKPREVQLYPTMNANDDPNPKSEFDETEDSKSDNEIYEKLKSCKSIPEQIHRLVSELELKPDEILKRNSLLQELESLLQSVTKEDCKLHLFGSSANGFGVKGSDLDIAFYMKDSSVADCDTSQLPAVDSTTEQDRIKLIAQTLRESGKRRYSNVYPVARARCPLVKFVHSPTNIKCDLSIKNDMGLLARQNTKLIEFFVNYQPFVRPVGFAIRHWAKLNDIAGNPNGGPRLSNYALTMLLLFYLHEINLVPSLEQLVQIADEDRTIDGWHCSFGTDIERLPPRPDNPSSLASVLCGFFDFYHNFDFMSNVICMRTAAAVDTIAFSQSLRGNLEHFRISSMCVQDPFVLNHNLTLNVTEKMKCKIVETFANAVAICQRPEFDVFSDSESEAGLLLLLRSTNAENHNSSNGSAVKDEESKDTERIKSFEIRFKLTSVAKEMIDRHPNVKELQDAWSRDVANLVLALLTNVLHFDCRSEPDVGEHQVNTTSGKLVESFKVTENVNSKRATDVNDSSDSKRCKKGSLENITGVVSSSLDNIPTSTCEIDTDRNGESVGVPPMSENSKMETSETSIVDSTVCSETVNSTVCSELAKSTICSESVKLTVCSEPVNSAVCSEPVNSTINVNGNSQHAGISTSIDSSIPIRVPPEARRVTNNFIPANLSSLIDAQWTYLLNKDNVMLLSTECSSNYALWTKRKKVRQQVFGIEQPYLKELEVTKILMSQEQNISLVKPLTFVLTLSQVTLQSGSGVRALLILPTDGNQKEFSVFVNYFRSLVIEMVKNCLTGC